MSEDKSSELLRKAFLESIKVLGERTTSLLHEELRQRKIDLNNTTLEELSAALRQIIGGDGAELIIQRVIRKLGRNKREPKS